MMILRVGLMTLSRVFLLIVQSSSLTLKDGIKLLEKALSQFQAGDEKRLRHL